MLMPKRVKWRKTHLPSIKGVATRGNFVAFGDYGIQAVGRGYLSAQTIESARVTMVRALKKGAKIWIRVFPHHPWTKKPLEVRMGGGKGDPEKWIAHIKPGKVLFEFSGVDEETAKEIARLVSYKIPFKVRLIKRDEEMGV